MEQRSFELKKDCRALVIGLGGSGRTYVSETKDLFVKRYGAEAVAERMDFLCIDTTDAGRPSNITDWEWLRIRGLSPNNPWINDWLNPDIDKLDLDLNWVSIRMVGRWKLFSMEIEVIGRLTEIIREYAQRLGMADGGINKVYVIVVSSICGGTGSGMVIDVPYFVRKTITHSAPGHMKRFEFYGILELPDSKEAGAIPDRIMMRANAYAAMKELYYFMGSREAAEPPLYTAQFADIPDHLFRSWDRIFDQCFLVSNKNGDIIDRNVYDESGMPKAIYLNMAIPEAINAMMSDPMIPRDADGRPLDGQYHFDFEQAMNNISAGGFLRNEQSGNWRFFATLGVGRIEKTAVEAFNQRMEPSFPVIADDALNANLNDNFSELFMPEHLSKHYRDIIDETPSRITVNIEKVNIQSTSMMIGVNFYFGLDLSSYFFMRDCKEAYDNFVKKYEEKGELGGVGLHIAEGPKEDIRPLLRPLEPLGRA